MASNTAYGPLIGHFDLNSEMGNGFDNTGTLTYLNTGYLTWAGITAGKAQSFYSFTGGGVAVLPAMPPPKPAAALADAIEPKLYWVLRLPPSNCAVM
jgi:hypothetical protein